MIAEEAAVDGAVVEEAPLSISQERRMLMEEWSRLNGWPRSPFNLASYGRILGPLDLDAFARALNRLIARHAALRATVKPSTGTGDRERREAAKLFGRTGLVRTGLYRQSLEPVAPVGLHVREIGRLSPERRLALVCDLVTDELATPFDYTRAPLLRTHVLRVSTQEHVFVLAVAHFAGDTLSIQVCWRDLWRLYDDDRSRSAHDSLENALQYTTFARAEHEALRTGALSASADYWRRQWAVFEDAQVSPAELAEAARLGMPAQTHSVEPCITLPEHLGGRIREIARHMRVTPFTIYLAAFAALLHLLTSRPRVGVWLPFANRVHPGAEYAVGWFAHYHMVGLEPSVCRGSWRHLVSHCRVQMTDALTHQHMPLAVVWQMLGRRAERRHPRIAFDWHTMRLTPASDHVTLEPLPAVTDRCVFPPTHEVALRIIADPQRLDARLMYTAGTFGPGVASQVLEHYRRILESLCEDADAPLPRGLTSVPTSPCRDMWGAVELP